MGRLDGRIAIVTGGPKVLAGTIRERWVPKARG
jgi:hypothetical protein